MVTEAFSDLPVPQGTTWWRGTFGIYEEAWRSVKYLFGRPSWVADVGISLALVSLSTLSIRTFLGGQPAPFGYLIASVAVQFISAIGLMVAISRDRVLHVSCFFFQFIFFGIAPLYQLSIGFDPIYSRADLIYSSYACAIGMSILLLVSTFVRMPKTQPMCSRLTAIEQAPANASELGLVLLLLLSVGCISYVLVRVGDSLFTSRSDLVAAVATDDTSTAAVITGFVMPLAFYSSFISVLAAYRRRPFIFWTALMVLLMALLINNPTVTARFRFGTILACIILTLYGIRRTRVQVGLLLAGVAAAPLFHAFRYGISGQGTEELGGTFAQMDYELLTLIAHAMLYVEQRGIAWGGNLISGLLFFVPRSVWSDKMFPTPYYLMDTLAGYRGYTSDNLSTPLLGEGYFALGAVGVLLVAISFIWGIRYIEGRALSGQLVWIIFAAASPLLVFMILRGSFMVSLGNVVSHVIAIHLSCWLLRLHGASGKHKSVYSRSAR